MLRGCKCCHVICCKNRGLEMIRPNCPKYFLRANWRQFVATFVFGILCMAILVSFSAYSENLQNPAPIVVDAPIAILPFKEQLLAGGRNDPIGLNSCEIHLHRRLAIMRKMGAGNATLLRYRYQHECHPIVGIPGQSVSPLYSLLRGSAI